MTPTNTSKWKFTANSAHTSAIPSRQPPQPTKLRRLFIMLESPISHSVAVLIWSATSWPSPTASMPISPTEAVGIGQEKAGPFHPLKDDQSYLTKQEFKAQITSLLISAVRSLEQSQHGWP